jgi:hypothetical protein
LKHFDRLITGVCRGSAMAIGIMIFVSLFSDGTEGVIKGIIGLGICYLLGAEITKERD